MVGDTKNTSKAPQGEQQGLHFLGPLFGGEPLLFDDGPLLFGGGPLLFAGGPLLFGGEASRSRPVFDGLGIVFSNGVRKNTAPCASGCRNHRNFQRSRASGCRNHGISSVPAPRAAEI